jgi:hypothetical protein
MLFTAAGAQASEAVVQAQIEQYKTQGATGGDAARGMALWNEQHMQPKLQKMVSCATCHGSNLSLAGEHVRTAKRIEPMAPSVNAERLTDPAKIEKWFRRNCDWTLGRACTAQEKADFLVFIQSK